jgi:hypothetical protein
VKCGGIALEYPIKSAVAKFQPCKLENYHMIQVIRGGESFSRQDHRATFRKTKVELKNYTESVHNETIKHGIESMPNNPYCSFRYGCKMWVQNGECVSGMSSTTYP